MKNITRVLDETFEEFYTYWDKVDKEGIIKHNRGLEAFFHNPKQSFNFQYLRYKVMLEKIMSLSMNKDINTIADFSGIFSVALSKLGFKVYVIEKFDLYYGTLDPIKDFLFKNNCIVVDFDSVMEKVELDEKVDLSISMAVIEHLIGSPKKYLDNIKNNSNKYIIVEVPNIASLYKRIKFFISGKSIFDEYDIYFNSSYPYFGHNHEYNITELKFIINYLGKTIEIKGFSYLKPTSLKVKIYKLITSFLPSSYQDSIYGIVKVENK